MYGELNVTKQTQLKWKSAEYARKKSQIEIKVWRAKCDITNKIEMKVWWSECGKTKHNYLTITEHFAKRTH